MGELLAFLTSRPYSYKIENNLNYLLDPMSQIKEIDCGDSYSVTIQNLDRVKNVTGDRGILLLDKLFEVTRNSIEGVDADRFRADHPDDLSLLDNLANKGLLTDRYDEKRLYRPSIYALPLIKHHRSKVILTQANSIINYLCSRYIEKLGEMIKITEIADDLGANLIEVTESFLYMRDGHGWFCGCSLTFPFGEGATVTTCENFLAYKSIDEIINTYYKWHFLTETNNSFYSELLESTDIKPGIFGFSIDIKRVLKAIFKKGTH
jgi:hypothetical protein